MREIKFRAWDKKVKKMYEPFSLYDELEEDEDWFRDLGNWLFLQYTGLKDKNGKEIYEGDICEIDGKAEETTKMEVDFEGGCFVVYPEWLKEVNDCKSVELKYYCGWKEEIMTIEVIGNIYDSQ